MLCNALGDFCSWWLRELVPLLPKSAVKASTISVEVAREQCIIYREINECRETLGATSPEYLGGRIREIPGAIVCDILIAPSCYLKRLLSQGRLPYGRAVAMAAIDLVDSTPLSEEDVYIGLEEPGATEDGTNYYIVKKNLLDAVLASLVESGIRPRFIRMIDGDRERVLSRESLAQISPAFSNVPWRRRFLQGAVVVLMVGLLLTYGHVYFRYAEASSQLSAQANAKQSEAVEVRKLLDERKGKLARLEAARNGKARSVPLVRIWDELTRVIPDSSWITDLTIQNDDVTIIGYSPVAAELISAIEASPLFHGTNFDAPVTRVPGRSGERFVIRTVIAR